MPECYKTLTLADGIEVKFYDQSNRYFGDFHKIRILVIAKIPIDKKALQEDLKLLLDSSTDVLIYETTLVRMAVPSDQLNKVRESLALDFLDNSSRYLSKKSFVERFLRKKLTMDKRKLGYNGSL
ncbi:MAG: hypothetical protein OQK50_03110 [Deltaproteobacteria bacterium]|jgi:hypothetical protein|nr:hypothetical protein [Deltaproteobacteria bacterium]MCW8894114.1 hypothetical protein [Deltaproteobacteria bacterium]MCW9049303.1 hypothetical protein [Deltaproteobacteria bacterium]